MAQLWQGLTQKIAQNVRNILQSNTFSHKEYYFWVYFGTLLRFRDTKMAKFEIFGTNWKILAQNQKKWHTFGLNWHNPKNRKWLSVFYSLIGEISDLIEKFVQKNSPGRYTPTPLPKEAFSDLIWLWKVYILYLIYMFVLKFDNCFLIWIVHNIPYSPKQLWTVENSSEQ